MPHQQHLSYVQRHGSLQDGWQQAVAFPSNSSSLVDRDAMSWNTGMSQVYNNNQSSQTSASTYVEASYHGHLDDSSALNQHRILSLRDHSAEYPSGRVVGSWAHQDWKDGSFNDLASNQIPLNMSTNNQAGFISVGANSYYPMLWSPHNSHNEVSSFDHVAASTPSRNLQSYERGLAGPPSGIHHQQEPQNFTGYTMGGLENLPVGTYGNMMPGSHTVNSLPTLMDRTLKTKAKSDTQQKERLEKRRRQNRESQQRLRERRRRLKAQQELAQQSEETQDKS